MFVFDVILEVTRLAKCLTTVRTFVRPQSQVNLFNVPIEFITSREFLGTVRTTEWFLSGVASEVSFEKTGKRK